MCGIFGILSREGDVSRDVLARAQNCLAHRGPDDSGAVVIDGSAGPPRQLGFAHTRLSIIDLSPLGHQPMQDPVTGSWIVFNGEIYNFRELRTELEAAGVEFRSHSDTEVILAAYRVWGESCLLRLGGMFAFALWDAPRKRLVLARDPSVRALDDRGRSQGRSAGTCARGGKRIGEQPRILEPAAVFFPGRVGITIGEWGRDGGSTACDTARCGVVTPGERRARRTVPLGRNRFQRSGCHPQPQWGAREHLLACVPGGGVQRRAVFAGNRPPLRNRAS